MEEGCLCTARLCSILNLEGKHLSPQWVTFEHLRFGVFTKDLSNYPKELGGLGPDHWIQDIPRLFRFISHINIR